MPVQIPFQWISRDGKLIILARTVGTFSQGQLAVILGVYLKLLGFGIGEIGLLLSINLAGTSLFSFIAGFASNLVGRRRLLLLFTATSAWYGLALVLTDNFWILALFAFMAGSIALQPIEQATIAGSVPSEKRTYVYALYNNAQTIPLALGALAVGLAELYQAIFGLGEIASYKLVFLGTVLFRSLAGVFYGLLSPEVEVAHTRRRWVNPLTTPSRRRILTFAALSSVDHFGGGLVTPSLVALWFFQYHGVENATSLGSIFFFSSLIMALSHWIAARLATWMGLLNTMVYTHIPSSILLMMIPFMPTVWLSIACWQLRALFSQMDLPTRESYTMAVVQPEERTAMTGTTVATRNAVYVPSPSLGAFLLEATPAGVGMFIAGGVLKGGYDVVLYFLFRRVKPPEEVRATPPHAIERAQAESAGAAAGDSRQAQA